MGRTNPHVETYTHLSMTSICINISWEAMVDQVSRPSWRFS